MPCCSTPLEILSSFSNEPRGTPRPAELLRNSKFPSEFIFEVTKEDLFITIAKVLEWGLMGGAGG